MSGKAILLNYIKFAVSTLCGTAVDMLLLWVCSHYLFTDYFGQYILSPSISFEGAVLTNYVVACHFVWHNRVSGESLKYKVLRFFGYNVSCLSGFAAVKSSGVPFTGSSSPVGIRSSETAVT